MFKISIADTPSRRTLLVEGTLIGAWVAELGKTWRNSSQDLGARKLVIDLTNVTVLSREGEDALFDLMKKGGELFFQRRSYQACAETTCTEETTGITTEVNTRDSPELGIVPAILGPE
jgi:hypothetical protein